MRLTVGMLRKIIKEEISRVRRGLRESGTNPYNVETGGYETWEHGDSPDHPDVEDFEMDGMPEDEHPDYDTRVSQTLDRVYPSTRRR